MIPTELPRCPDEVSVVMAIIATQNVSILFVELALAICAGWTELVEHV
jgi:hypothetical protein